MALYENLPAADRKALDRKLGKKKSSWSKAQPTTVGGMKFPSKLEAKIYHRLQRNLKPDERIFRQARMILLTLATKPGGCPYYFTVDFMVVQGLNKITRLVDAKGRISREWTRGKAACEAAYGIKVEEIRA